MRLLLNKHSLKFQTIWNIFDPAAGHVKITIRFQWGKLLFLAVYSRSQYYQLLYIFVNEIVFTDHEIICKEPKFVILLHTVQM